MGNDLLKNVSTRLPQRPPSCNGGEKSPHFFAGRGIGDAVKTAGLVDDPAEEQSFTSREISDNMHKVTDVIQDTAKETHATSQAADQLNRLADELGALAGQFRVS